MFFKVFTLTLLEKDTTFAPQHNQKIFRLNYENTAPKEDNSKRTRTKGVF